MQVIKMADDLDVEALLEAPFRRDEESVSVTAKRQHFLKKITKNYYSKTI